MVVVNWLGILFLVIGVASIIVVKLKDIKNKSFVKRCSSTAEATIIDVKMSKRIDNGIVFVSFNPTVEFYVQNDCVEKKYKPVNPFIECHAGQKVKAFYNPNNPEEFYLDTDRKKKVALIEYKFGEFYILIGLFMVIVYLLVKNR